MLKNAREKTILKQGLIVIGISAGLYVFVLSPFLKEGSNILDEEIERKTSEIKRYITRTGAMPTKEGFSKLEKENIAMEEKLTGLMDFVDPYKTRISEASSEAGLYFIEKLHSLMKGFSEEGVSKGVTLPENLGFGDGLPKDNMVDTLLRQLETVEFAIKALLKADSIEISAIKPLKSIDYIEPLTKKVFYTELPVQISIKTTTAAFINLLLELKNKSPVVSVKEVHIKNSGSGTEKIEASMVLSTFMVVRAAEKKE